MNFSNPEEMILDLTDIDLYSSVKQNLWNVFAAILNIDGREWKAKTEFEPE